LEGVDEVVEDSLRVERRNLVLEAVFGRGHAALVVPRGS
jgi:hypothetical protein